MGQAKQNKLRLGKWYGQPIGPGHPDFVPPKKPEPSTHVDRVVEKHVQVRDAWSAPGTKFVLTNQNDPSENGVYTADRFGNLHRAETTKEEPMHPEVVRTLTDVQSSQEGPTPDEQRPSERLSPMRPKTRRVPGLMLAAMFGIIASSGIDLGPEPEYRPKKR